MEPSRDLEEPHHIFIIIVKNNLETHISQSISLEQSGILSVSSCYCAHENISNSLYVNSCACSCLCEPPYVYFRVSQIILINVHVLSLKNMDVFCIYNP